VVQKKKLISDYAVYTRLPGKIAPKLSLKSYPLLNHVDFFTNKQSERAQTFLEKIIHQPLFHKEFSDEPMDGRRRWGPPRRD
jgi:hypothetical protein